MTPSEAIYLVNAVLSVFSPRAGYSGQDFDWADYHKQHGTEEAPPFGFRNVRSLVLATALFLDMFTVNFVSCFPFVSKTSVLPWTTGSLLSFRSFCKGLLQVVC